MQKYGRIFGLLVFMLMIFPGCEKENPNYISIDCLLVDESGNQKSSFSLTDSIIFEFYLSNFSGETAIYTRPCSEFADYLKVYQESSGGDYVYYGRPVYYCLAVTILDSLADGEVRLVGRIPWIEELDWPVKKTGRYYVGDTLSLVVNDIPIKTRKRIYFEIE